jgi:ATP-dependent DNA ligase
MMQAASSSMSISEKDGEIVFREACKLGCEGIVSKRAWLALSLRALTALA